MAGKKSATTQYLEQNGLQRRSIDQSASVWNCIDKAAKKINEPPKKLAEMLMGYFATRKDFDAIAREAKRTQMEREMKEGQ